MRRIGLVATREFLGTVATKGFIVGVLVMPVMLAFVITVTPRLMNQRSVPVRGQVAVVDPTGQVASELRMTIAPGAIAARREELARRAMANAPAAVRDLAGGQNAGTTNTAVATALGSVPDLELVERAPGGDLQPHKAWLTESVAGTSSPERDPSTGSGPGRRHVALVVVHPDAVSMAAGRADYGTYDLYIPANLDDRVETAVIESLREAIVNARVRAEGIDRSRVDAILRVPRTPSTTVTKGLERTTNAAFNRVLPFAFTGLLLFGVLMGGQGLVTSTVEEKSSRVIEVLLSAVSPFELMAGKILGQMGVSLAMLAIYIALGLVMLASFTLLGLLDPKLVLYLILFFVITYLTIGSLMAAVGAAVNEMREAQQLMTPIIMTMMIPWLLAAPIAREPNSAFSTIISFIPPVNTFAMLLRLTSSAPPPDWQVWLTIAIGLVSVVGAVWFASKVFKIGLLMYGKPPNVATLIRWARAA